MYRLVLLVVMIPACWAEDGRVCHYQDSSYAEDVFDQTCQGVTTTYVSRGCNFDDDWWSQRDCENACPVKATCKLKERRGSYGGYCTATICS
ncbi:MAG TPA: hypothetical protein VMZ53_30425 [Kofleriaceae bacterium]|nr:hypothetical protein [Kofleriaceae bacterium]